MSTFPLGVEARNCPCMCQQREGRRKYKKKQDFFSNTSRGEEEFSPVERAEVRAQITDGPQGLVGVSIREFDELVWMFLKEGGVLEDRGNYF